jgi:hypothetical protein
LSEIANIRYIAEPIKSEGLLWLPHTRDWQQDWRSIDMRGARRILTHNTFAGAVGANGVELGGIPLDALPNVPIISGDIHSPQRNGRLTYVGAPYTVDFGDEYEPRADPRRRQAADAAPERSTEAGGDPRLADREPDLLRPSASGRPGAYPLPPVTDRIPVVAEHPAANPRTVRA